VDSDQKVVNKELSLPGGWWLPQGNEAQLVPRVGDGSQVCYSRTVSGCMQGIPVHCRSVVSHFLRGWRLMKKKKVTTRTGSATCVESTPAGPGVGFPI